MNVEFVRAGAGSGKTHYLTQLLAQRLRDGSARPHAVLATTFTVKAASELRERARARLLKEGCLDLSAAIGQAKIGTINSVCGQLIKRFCFELGISPDQTVLDEQQGKQLVGIAIESVQSPSEVQALMDLGHRLGIGSDDRRPVNTEQKRRDALTARTCGMCAPGRREFLTLNNRWRAALSTAGHIPTALVLTSRRRKQLRTARPGGRWRRNLVEKTAGCCM